MLVPLAALVSAAGLLLATAGPADAASTFTTQAPRISGAVQVGSKITAIFPTWKPMPTAKGYRWLRDGSTISGATKSTYTPTAQDRGHRLFLTIIGAKSGYSQATRTKDLGIVATGAAPKATIGPKLSGSATAGGTLTTTSGTWNTSGLSVRYQWLRNGSIVKDQTKRTYPVSSADYGATLASRVIVSKSGYADGSARSAVTGKIGRPAAAFSGNGVFAVGSKIKPGTYFSSNTRGCYWERLSGASGDFEDVIENDFGSGQRMIRVGNDDRYVSFSDCGSWYPIASAGPRLAKIPADGVYKVGQQVGPGSWRTSFTDGCYWETLSSASGSIDVVIANDYLDGRGSTTVDISSDVYAFSTSGCGTWSKVG
ncbi:hypothetical protein ACRQ4C_07345 [Curtobacterium sp. SP.BCp]|uniref:hypothetical protein n=1 Tax=Curtobacterium sp. SP.BCp TaxID=3435230 RepID=UPI003F738A3E